VELLFGESIEHITLVRDSAAGSNVLLLGLNDLALWLW